MLREKTNRVPSLFPLCVSADLGLAPVGTKTSYILSGTDGTGSYANWIQVFSGERVKDGDSIVYVDGWVDGNSPYTDPTSDLYGTSDPTVGLISQSPITIQIPSSFAVSSISIRNLDSDIDSYYITYGCTIDRNNRADNTLAQNQNL